MQKVYASPPKASKIVRCMRDIADLRKRHKDLAESLGDATGEIVEVIFSESSVMLGEHIQGARDVKPDRITGRSVDELVANFKGYLDKNNIKTLSLKELEIDGRKVLIYHFRLEYRDRIYGFTLTA